MGFLVKAVKSVVKVGAIVAGVALAIPTGGTSLLALGLGVSSLAAVGIAAGLTLASSLLSTKPKSPAVSNANSDRLNANIDPRAARKIVFGQTAMATDIRDQEFTGEDDEYLHRFLVVASHKVQSIDEIWFDDKKAWTSGGGVQGEYAGYLTVATRLEGTAANAINISARMGSTRRYTGLAYVHFRYKLTGNSKKASSPFASSIPTRVTIKGKGMPVYDPRKDSTRGGSGTQRIDDQSTWVWDNDACNNPALQLLTYLTGWRINGKLAVGKGIPAARLNIESFADAANMCDEPIALEAGGTEPRYRTAGIFSEADGMELVLDQYKSSMNAVTDDADGRIRVQVLHNDLAFPIADFNEDDILGEVDWRPRVQLSDRFNVIRGSYTDPRDNSLYQPVDYTEISLPSPDGMERSLPVHYPLVQSHPTVQRLIKQRIQRAQYPGMLSFVGASTWWKVIKNDVVRLTFRPLAMENKLFRVVACDAQMNGQVNLLLREENAAIYLWDKEEGPEPELAPPTTYNYLNNPLLLEVDDLYLDIGTLTADLESALALAASRGKVWTTPTAPSTATSNIGDTWIAPDGVFYDRVPGSIVLDGKVIVLDGYRPSIYWTRSANQPLAETISTASEASSTANSVSVRIEAYDNDDILDVSEKRRLILDDAQLETSYQEIIISANALAVDYTALTTARTNYLAFRNGLSPAWNDTTQDTPVTRNSLDSVIVAYRTEFEKLRSNIENQIDKIVTFDDGEVRLRDTLVRDIKVAPLPGSEIYHHVIFKPLIFRAEHDEIVQYQDGNSYGAVPDNIEVDVAGAALPALTVGEAYDIRAIDVTDTQFKVRAIKTTASGSATQTSGAGTNVGGTPAWQTNKPSAANAKDGVYIYSFTATLAKAPPTQIDKINEGVPSTWIYTSIYEGTVTLYGKVGAAWTSLWSGKVSSTFSTTGTNFGHDGTKSFVLSKSVNSGADLGSGAGRFGIHQGAGATVTAFTSVKYSTQTTGAETVVGGLFKFTVHPPTET